MVPFAFCIRFCFCCFLIPVLRLSLAVVAVVAARVHPVRCDNVQLIGRHVVFRVGHAAAKQVTGSGTKFALAVSGSGRKSGKKTKSKNQSVKLKIADNKKNTLFH